MLVLVPIIPGTIDEGVLALQDNKRTTEVEVIEAAKMALPAEQRPAISAMPQAAVDELCAVTL